MWAEITRPDGGTDSMGLAMNAMLQFGATYDLNLPGVYIARIRARGETMAGSPFERERMLTATAVPGGDIWDPTDPKTNPLCELLQCLEEHGVIGDRLREVCKKLGVDLDALLECLDESCRSDPSEDPRRESRQVVATQPVASCERLMNIVEQLRTELGVSPIRHCRVRMLSVVPCCNKPGVCARAPQRGGSSETGAARGAGDVVSHFRASRISPSHRRPRTRNSYRLPLPPQEKNNAASYVRQLVQLNLGVQSLRLVDPNHPVFFRDPDPLSVPGRIRLSAPGSTTRTTSATSRSSTARPSTGSRGSAATRSIWSVQAISGFPGAGTTGDANRDVAARSDRGGHRWHVHDPCGPGPQPGNWLASVPETSLISVREAFNEWSNPGSRTVGTRGRRSERQAGEHAVESAADHRDRSPRPSPSPNKLRTGPVCGNRSPRCAPRGPG